MLKKSVLKKVVSVTASLLMLGSAASVSAAVVPDGTYSKGEQWYLSEDTSFDFSGIRQTGSISAMDCTFSAKSPAAIYQPGVSEYNVSATVGNSTYSLKCKIGMKGDVNGDQKTDVFDAIAIAQFSVGKMEISDDFAAFKGDVNKDGILDVFDAVSLTRLINEEEHKALVEKNKAEEAYISRVVELVNTERAKEGLSPVTMTSELNEAADVRAKEITKSWSHTRPNGSSCFTVLDQRHIEYMDAGENVAFGYTSPEDLVKAWMESPGHRANIMNSCFTKIGVGHYFNKGDGLNYWSQFFTN